MSPLNGNAVPFVPAAFRAASAKQPEGVLEGINLEHNIARALEAKANNETHDPSKPALLSDRNPPLWSDPKDPLNLLDPSHAQGVPMAGDYEKPLPMYGYNYPQPTDYRNRTYPNCGCDKWPEINRFCWKHSGQGGVEELREAVKRPLVKPEREPRIWSYLPPGAKEQEEHVLAAEQARMWEEKAKKEAEIAKLPPHILMLTPHVNLDAIKDKVLDW